MYKVVIVDDNPYDVEGIRKILECSEIDISIVGTYSSGYEALQNIPYLEPHIVITDIQMPEIDGIELAQIIKEKHKNTKIIFVSCYDDFDFAKTAIDLDVFGYILKPIISEQLLNAVRKVLNICENENQMQKERTELLLQINNSLPVLREEFLRGLLFSSEIDKIENLQARIEFLKFNLPTQYCVRTICIQIGSNSNDKTNADVSDEYFFASSVKKVINSFDNKLHRMFAIQTSNNGFALVAFSNSTFEDTNISFLELIVSIKETVSKQFDVLITIGISNFGTYFSEIPRLYQQSLSAIKTKFFKTEDEIILYEEIEELPGQTFVDINLQSLFNEIKEILLYKTEEDVAHFLDKYLDTARNIAKDESFIKSFIYTIINILQVVLIEENESFDSIFGNQFTVWEKLNNFDTIVNVKQLIFNMFKMCIEYLQRTGSGSYGQIASDIKKIIHENYHQRLVIKDICDMIYFSPTRANYIFKQETGKTIFDYLTEYRIIKAQELLQNPYSKIYSVMNEVGYVNKANFNLQFKRITGYTPTQYRDKKAKNRGE